MRPLIVGEAPSKNEPHCPAIEGRIGARLAACCGMTLTTFLAYFARINVLEVRQDTREKGFAFDAKQAKRNAELIIEREFHKGRTILLLGLRVAIAFGADPAYFGSQQGWNGATVYVVPHPSGINRWWNKLDNELQMIKFMHQIVERTR